MSIESVMLRRLPASVISPVDKLTRTMDGSRDLTGSGFVPDEKVALA
jgi:hypothetical protein